MDIDVGLGSERVGEVLILVSRFTMPLGGFDVPGVVTAAATTAVGVGEDTVDAAGVRGAKKLEARGFSLEKSQPEISPLNHSSNRFCFVFSHSPRPSSTPASIVAETAVLTDAAPPP